MSNDLQMSILEQTRVRFRQFVEKEHLLDTNVSVLAKPLTPEEAIGTPGRRDFPIITGKERVVESNVLGAKGHAFTDSPREFLGVVEDVLRLDLTTNSVRAIYVATLNSILAHLNLAKATVHCKDDDPEKCASEISRHLLDRYGPNDVGLIGLNPAIAERLVETFGADHVCISDLPADNIGNRRFGVEVWDGNERIDDLVDASDVVLMTGTTLINSTFDKIQSRIQKAQKPYLLYGVTAAGVCHLLGIERICPFGRDG